jgi:hypothetical protein
MSTLVRRTDSTLPALLGLWLRARTPRSGQDRFGPAQAARRALAAGHKSPTHRPALPVQPSATLRATPARLRVVRANTLTVIPLCGATRGIPSYNVPARPAQTNAQAHVAQSGVGVCAKSNQITVSRSNAYPSPTSRAADSPSASPRRAADAYVGPPRASR